MADHRAYRVGSNLTIGPVPFYGAGAMYKGGAMSQEQVDEFIRAGKKQGLQRQESKNAIRRGNDAKGGAGPIEDCSKYKSSYIGMRDCLERNKQNSKTDDQKAQELKVKTDRDEKVKRKCGIQPQMPPNYGSTRERTEDELNWNYQWNQWNNCSRTIK